MTIYDLLEGPPANTIDDVEAIALEAARFLKEMTVKREMQARFAIFFYLKLTEYLKVPTLSSSGEVGWDSVNVLLQVLTKDLEILRAKEAENARKA